MRTRLLVLASLALGACGAPPPVAPPAEPAAPIDASDAPMRAPVADASGLHDETGAPIVVVVETRDRSLAVTAELVRDPSRTDLHDMLAPNATASVDLDAFRRVGTLWAGL